ncbi:MAG: AMP-binding protein [Chloroflexi bacterium]|nr:AMP-binding protein [Chloroflexota bacterium]
MVKRYYRPELETMSHEDFRRFQWAALQKQLKYTYERSGLCRRQFEKAKLTPDNIRSLDDFIHRVPFTTKQDMLADQEAHPPYGTRLAVREDEIAVTYLTSGTSGKGVEVHTLSHEDLAIYPETMCMTFTWAGWQRGDKVMSTLPVGVTMAGAAHMWAMQRIGCDVFNLGIYDTKTKLDYMQRFKIKGIFASPAYLESLTAEAEKMGLDPARDLCVQSILMGGQAYPVSFAERMKAKWNAEISDYYGSTQWAASATCENGAVRDGRRGSYHLFGYKAFAEVINPDTLEPVKPGEFGEVVLTPLNKRASPFLRFRSADRARYFPQDACDCGRPFDLLEAGTIGRYDAMMKVKGTNIWPETIDDIVLVNSECIEYRGRLYISDEGKERSEIAVEFRPSLAEDTKQRLMSHIAEEIRHRTGIGFIVKEADGELPRYVFKARRWTDERASGMAQRA